MSLLGLRGEAQADERLEQRALVLLTAFFAATPARLVGQLHDAFTWFGRALAPAELDAARLARLSARGPLTPARPRTVPHPITHAWSAGDGTIVPPGTQAVVLVDLVAERGAGETVTVALAFAATEPEAPLLAVFDATTLVPHLRALA